MDQQTVKTSSRAPITALRGPRAVIPEADRSEVRRIVAGEPGPVVRGESDPLGADHEEQVPIADWQRSEGSLLLFIADRQAVLVPGGNLVWIPTAKAMQQLTEAKPHINADLGNFFEVPATGASGSRIFRATPRTALMLDAGSNPVSRVPAAVYLDQVEGVMSNLGLVRVQRLQAIHIHHDHISEIPSIVAEYGVKASELIIPASCIGVNREIRQVVDTLRNTTDASLLTAGFGAAWEPGSRLPDLGGPGDVLRHGYKVGELEVENVALRSALRQLSSDPKRFGDLASYLTKVTRTTDRSMAVVLGDLRGTDLETFRNAMEAERPGSWNEMFQGMTTLSGFSHHVGRMDTADVTGMMSLLEATLLRTGSLRVVEQTHTGEHEAARRDTIELAQRLGIELVYTDMPGAASGPSAAGATRSTVYARGPESATRGPIASNLTIGLQRLQRLVGLQDTLERWQPHAEETGNAKAVEELRPLLQRSIEDLRAGLRTAVEAGLRVRAGNAVDPATGGKDYNAPVGPRSRRVSFADALARIPAATAAETALGNEGMASLEALGRLKEGQAPARVTLDNAMARGEYTDQAYSTMLASLDKPTRDELIYGRRGGRSPRLKAFERVRAEFGFRSAILQGTEHLGMPRQGMSAGARIGVRGAAGGMAALEAWNAAVVPILSTIETNNQMRAYTLVRFSRRLAFWSQAGILPKLVAVADNLFSTDEERDYIKIQEGLERWNLMYFEAPGISDEDADRFGEWLSYHVRNLDEFNTLFEDSGQDAVTWEVPEGKAWDQAVWKVNVGTFETSGFNRVDESWIEHPRLTKVMRGFVPGLIHGTETLLSEEAAGRAPSAILEAEVGKLEGFEGKHLYRARLRQPAAATEVAVEAFGWSGGQRTARTVSWWSPPDFWVLEERDGQALVTGADYSTYAILRSLKNERRDPVISQYASVMTTRTGNLYGRVWIPSAMLERLPPG